MNGIFRTRAPVVLLVTALATLSLALLPGRATAATVHVNPTPVAGTSVNGIVRAVAIGNAVAYVGGEFTSVTGTNGTYARTRVAAFNLSTGAVITSFRADTNGVVRALAFNGSSLYIGGEYSYVNGTYRGNLAEVQASTGAVVSGFQNNTAGAVLALSVGGGRLYVGGWFSSIRGLAQRRVAAVDLASRAVVTGFRPSVDGTVHAISASPAGDRVWIGGSFINVGGVNRRYLAALTSGGAQAGTNFNLSDNQPVLALDTNENGSRVYAGIAGYANRAAAYSTSSGGRLWYQTAMGDVQAIAYHGGNVFFGFHEGFGGDTSVRLLAADAASGRLESAFRPSMNSFWGVRALDANARGVLAGGEFTRVNGVTVGRVASFRPR